MGIQQARMLSQKLRYNALNLFVDGHHDIFIGQHPLVDSIIFLS